MMMMSGNASGAGTSQNQQQDLVESPSKMLVWLEQVCQEWMTRMDWNFYATAVTQHVAAMKENKEVSLTARKQLTETTKGYKRAFKAVEQSVTAVKKNTSTNTPEVDAMCKAWETVSKESKTTIKSYQEEVDRITKRCRQVEQQYSQLGQALFPTTSDASFTALVPPATALQTCMQHVEHQQEAMQQLQAQLAQVQQERDHWKQQAEQAQAAQAAVSNEASESNNAPANAISQAPSTPSLTGLMSGGGGSSSNLSKQEREELVQLRREVAEYEVEFRSLKNQDITIRKLEAKIAELQTAAQETLQEELAAAKQELAATEGRRATEALEREAAAERKVQMLELQLAAERAGQSAHTDQWLEQNEGLSQREAAWEAQRRILVEDADRLREALQVTTRERDDLQLRVAAVQQQGGNTASGGGATATATTAASVQDLLLERSAFEAEVAELSETVTHLREDLRQQQELFNEQQRIAQQRMDQEARERQQLQARLETAQEQLARAPTQSLVNSMQRELRILKRLEYNDYGGGDGDDPQSGGGHRNPETAGGDPPQDDDLESVLVAKLRRAESELVSERIAKADLLTECNRLKESIQEANAAREEADQLVASLELDLERALAAANAATSEPNNNNNTTQASSTAVDPLASSTALENILDPNAAARTPQQQQQQPATPSSSTSTQAAMTRSSSRDAERDDHSVATIVMAQRDRLRARCEALEAERDSFKRELQVQVEAAESLKTDNSKLYEKVRYLQNYNQKTSSSNLPMAPMSRGRDLDLEALEQRYEASVDPFRQFSKAERQRKLNEMSPMERAVFIVAKTVLATREMRTALFIYVVALHLLVFVTTTHWSHSTSGCGVGGSNANNEHLSHLPPDIQNQIAQQAAAAAAGAQDAAATGIRGAAAAGGGA